MHCQRIESNRPGKTGGWYHKRTDLPMAFDVLPGKKEPAKTDAQLDAEFRRNVERWCAKQAKVIELAAHLGVSIASLTQLGVGWNGCCWTIPERSPAGLIVGVTTRAAGGTKRMLVGSRRGLVYSVAVMDCKTETVLIVEGASDTAAGLTLGIPTIGRPSNVCGGDVLTELLAGWQGRIVVMGESDRREPKPIAHHPHAPDCKGCQRCFPGKYGMEAVAKALRQHSRYPPVSMRMPPDGAKDLRGYLNGLKVDPENAEACAKVGRSMLRRMHVLAKGHL